MSRETAEERILAVSEALGTSTRARVVLLSSAVREMSEHAAAAAAAATAELRAEVAELKARLTEAHDTAARLGADLIDGHAPYFDEDDGEHYCACPLCRTRLVAAAATPEVPR